MSALDYESRQMPGQRCPFCRSTAVVKGKLVGRDGDAGFIPDGLKSFAWTFTTPGVILLDVAFVCIDCGALWSRADISKLREVLARWGKDGVE